MINQNTGLSATITNVSASEYNNDTLDVYYTIPEGNYRFGTLFGKLGADPSCDVTDDIYEYFAYVCLDDTPTPPGTPTKPICEEVDGKYYGKKGKLVETYEEWIKIFKEYYQDVSLSYYAWPGEEKEKRRLFVLKKLKNRKAL